MGGDVSGEQRERGQKKSGRITHGNRQVKTTLVEAAWGATRTKGTYCNARYHRLAGRRGKKRALIAIGHMILKAVYFIVRDKVPFRELGFAYYSDLNGAALRRSLERKYAALGYRVELTPIVEEPKESA